MKTPATAPFFVNNKFSTISPNNNNILQKKKNNLDIITHLLQQGESVHFVAQGPSMYPIIPCGTRVCVKPWNHNTKIKLSQILFFQQHNRLTLHRMIRHDTTNKIFYIVADAALSGIETVAESNVLGIGQYLFRGQKQYRLNALHFRLFGLLLYYARPLRRLWAKIRKKAETLKN